MYTVYNHNTGAIYGRNLSAIEAADIVLTYNGASYELRHDDEYDLAGNQCWQLYVNSAYGQRLSECYVGSLSHSTLARAYAVNKDAAWEKIAQDVVTSCGEWDGPDVMTDADFDAMIAAG